MDIMSDEFKKIEAPIPQIDTILLSESMPDDPPVKCEHCGDTGIILSEDDRA